MEIYADYNYYKTEYRGTLDESSFDKYSDRATRKICNRSSGRATSDLKEVKNCMCELVELMSQNESLKTDISSEKVDNFTRNFVLKTVVEKNQEYNSVIKEYLGSLGLLGGSMNVY